MRMSKADFRGFTGALALLFIPMAQGLAAPSSRAPEAQDGLASYYHDKYQGRRTASGEIYRKTRLTAAHKTLPFGTVLRVTNKKNNRSVLVRVNDRGKLPRVTLDLSKAAAKRLRIIRDGVARVRIQIVRQPGGRKRSLKRA